MSQVHKKILRILTLIRKENFKCNELTEASTHAHIGKKVSQQGNKKLKGKEMEDCLQAIRCVCQELGVSGRIPQT